MFQKKNAKMPSKRAKKYSKEDFEKAVEAVRRKVMTVRKASAKFGVPKSTLMDRVGGKHSSQMGRPRVLTDEEEMLIIDRIKVRVLIQSDFCLFNVTVPTHPTFL